MVNPTILERFRLDGKVAVVTGASSGLGVVFALALADAGADVVLAGRRQELLTNTAEEVKALGRRALTARCDVRSPDDCEAMISSAVCEFGKVDVLVNNAGVGEAVPAIHEEPEHFRWHIETNLEGAYWCAQSFARTASRGSSIVNVASTLALRPTKFSPQAGYVASKAGLIGLTRDLAMQWTSRRGIRVNALAPGYFPSEMTDQINDEHRSGIAEATLIGRFGRLDEVTPAMIFLASDASSYITGTTLAVDGGLSLH
jgi:NAD(P)-dependent dehydrogenase (short-subunit alcohol dehydrogenase family)